MSPPAPMMSISAILNLQPLRLQGNELPIHSAFSTQDPKFFQPRIAGGYYLAPGPGVLREIEPASVFHHEFVQRLEMREQTIDYFEIQGDTVRSYHVGDSMTMVCGQRGKIKFQSVAHSPVGYAVESGLLDQDEAVHHEHRHIISNTVGDAEMRIEIGATLKLSRFDTLLLASDGLTDNLYIDEIVQFTRKGALDIAAKQLIDLAHARMTASSNDKPSHPDDLSLILYRPGKN